MNQKGSSDTTIVWVIAGIVVVFAFVYGIAKAIDALTHPSLVWWVVGFVSCLIVEGLALLVFYLTRHWNDLFNTVRRWFRETF